MQGEAQKPDCTISIKEADFISLIAGKLNGQQAFMQVGRPTCFASLILPWGQGKIKIKGNMGLAMKLGELSKLKGAAPPAASAGSAPSSSGSGAAALFNELATMLKSNPEVVKVVHVLGFWVCSPDSCFRRWVVSFNTMSRSRSRSGLLT